MLKMVDGTGIIGVDMICPLGVSTPQPPNYDRVELEGAGMLVLPNSLDAPLERLELGGKTEQVQTTGAQLLKPKDGSYTVFGVSVDIANGEIKLSGTATSSGGRTIRLSEPFLLKAGTYSSEVDGKIDFILSKNSDNSYLVNLAVKNFNVNEDTEVYVGLNVMAQNTYNNKYHIMLNSGNIPLPYEPYTGGKPSPSPEYPQEIKNSGKWNEEKQKYEVDVKVTGRNLFNGKLLKGKFIADDMNVVSDLVTMNTFDKPVEIEPNTDYVISANGVIWEGNINVYDENGKKIAQHFTGKFKTPSNAKYIRASISNARAPIDSKIQMEYGTAMNEFEQYHQPQTLTLTSDRPLTKWDRLVEQGGEIGWLYGSVIATIDETADISLYAPNGFFIHVKNIDKKEKTGYCDKLYTKKMSNGEPFVLFGIANNNFLYTLNTQEFYGKTASEIKAKLKEYPLNIIGKSETTEFIPLQQSEQNAIRALKTYYPTTVITADGGELDPDIKVTYRKEI